MEYDLLIKNGLVVDGSGMPGFLADVGIKDGKVVAFIPDPATNPTNTSAAEGVAVDDAGYARLQGLLHFAPAYGAVMGALLGLADSVAGPPTLASTRSIRSSKSRTSHSMVLTNSDRPTHARRCGQ